MPEEPGVLQEAHGSYIAQATHGGTATVQVYTSPASLPDQNRQRFLVRLRTRYRDLLEQSLQEGVRLSLRLAERPRAVEPPVRVLSHPPQQPTCPLSAGTTLAQAYAHAGQELLLQGEPGAGKSTLLLELALTLVEQAALDHSQPLPVIVPLSSWASKRQPLSEWLAEQIALLYDIAPRLSQRWVREERLLPFLDGLDEMEEGARVACIEAINAYHREHLHPLVVGSRKAEYDAAACQQRLALHRAIVVQPLTTEQVDTYLAQSGEPVAALRSALHTNPVLQEIATTPLMLSILILTYQGQAVHALSLSEALGKQQIFARYVQRMLERKAQPLRSTQHDLIHWLSWLAQQMRKQSQTVFYLEHLQPDWLERTQRRQYAWWAVRVPALLVGMLISLLAAIILGGGIPETRYLFQYAALGGLLGWLFSRPASTPVSPGRQPGGPQRQTRFSLLGRSLPAGILVGLVFGLSLGTAMGSHGFGPGEWLGDGLISGAVMGLSSFLLSWLLPGRAPSDASASTTTTQRGKKLFQSLQMIHGQRALLTTPLVGLGYGLSTGLRFGLVNGLTEALAATVNFGLISVFLSLILQAQTERIALTERLRWTWGSLSKSLLRPGHLRTTLVICCVVGAVYTLGSGLNEGIASLLLGYKLSAVLPFALISGLTTGLSGGLSTGLIYWLLLGLFQGIASEQIEDRARQVPNQGMQRCWHNGLLMALISAGIFAVIGTLGFGLSYVPARVLLDTLHTPNRLDILRLTVGFALSTAWLMGVCGGLLAWSMSGGQAIWRHYLIRLLLARSHAFPWRAPQFLEDATARILLRRVGGGYSFPHRLLLEYFADLPQQTP